MTGKLIIWAAKMKADNTPMSGTMRSFIAQPACLTQQPSPPAETAQAETHVVVERKPSGMCMGLSLDATAFELVLPPE